MTARVYTETPRERVCRLRRAVERANNSITWAAQMEKMLPEFQRELAQAQAEVERLEQQNAPSDTLAP
jgi:hypothetical protein